MLGQIDNESFKLSALLSKIVMSEPVTFDDDKFEISALLTKIVLSAPHDFTNSFQLSASLQNFEFFTP